MNPSSKKTISEDVRLQIEVPANYAAEVDRLSNVCGFKTRRETIVAALSTLMWVSQEIFQGNRVGSLDPTGTRFKEVVPLSSKLMTSFIGNATAKKEHYIGAKSSAAHV